MVVPCPTLDTKCYRPRQPRASPLWNCVREHFAQFRDEYAVHYNNNYGPLRPVVRDVVKRFLKCGDLHERFARVRCPTSAARTRLHPGTVLRRPPVRPGSLRRVKQSQSQATRRSPVMENHALFRLAGLTVNRISGKMHPRKERKCTERDISQAAPTLRPVSRGSGFPP
jgi:hypothetical protein